MAERRKRSEKPTCPWCGTKLRFTEAETPADEATSEQCPRGPACAKEEANHDALVARIAKEKRK